MKLEFKNGDLLKASEYFKVHQVNCQGVMGSGIAKSIKEKYPKVFEEYKNFYKFCKSIPNNQSPLGIAQISMIENGAIINLFGQDGYGKGRQTNYEAFYQGLENIKRQIMNNNYPREVAFPYKIGSDRGGADWNIILTMINVVFNDTDFSITIYKYNPNENTM